MIELLDHVPFLWQTISAIVAVFCSFIMVVFSSYPLSPSQTKQAVEPGVVPV